MTKKLALQLFQEQKIRTVWDDEAEKWYFSVVDVVAVLTDSTDPRNYWKVLKNRLKKDGNETVTNCNRLKMPAPDGKMRMTDVVDSEQLFRLIQSIPSHKAPNRRVHKDLMKMRMWRSVVAMLPRLPVRTWNSNSDIPWLQASMQKII